MGGLKGVFSSGIYPLKGVLSSIKGSSFKY
jgi:hypothetical protein